MKRLRELIENVSGYNIVKKGYLPVGASLVEDILYKLRVEPRLIFDVGANIGQTCERFREGFPDATIYAFEPFQEAFSLLENKFLNEDMVKPYHLGFGSEKARLNVVIDQKSHSVLNSFRNVAKPNKNRGEMEEVEVSTVDLFMKSIDFGYLDILKIDTEGWEVEVLKGAENILKERKVGAVYCECGFSENNNRNTYFSSICQFLESYEYFFYGLYGIRHNQFKRNTHYANALFVHKDKI
ncbi:MAG: FkbM family methyltransferase [Marinoscillum sp.]